MSGGERSTAAGDPGPFALGPWRVEPGLNRLHGPGGEVTLEPRAMELLVCLARHAGETVSKEQLLEEVWRGAFVVEGVIPKTVHALRQALGDDATAGAPAVECDQPPAAYRTFLEARHLWERCDPPEFAAIWARPAGCRLRRA
ncbi:MAG: hypothetical protein F9K16_06160 [Thermoanaerobaculia bacterium]|nr:MAG: hypothetical protein F9K16_06160 [Thermoanaerobaculia bacterium]MBZ0102290.1 winged helix-turn-helix domain-containing protein [Thermoanaerobaculia bacterium]